jgi:hypothetical protein
MNKSTGKLSIFIEYFLSKISALFYREYGLKLEDYYYDHKKSIYMVVLRFRNKNAIIKRSILSIIKDKNLINNLHPYDSYQIGKIKTMNENKYIVTNVQIERDFDDYYVIDPCVDWVGTDLTENKLVFKAKSSSSQIKVSIDKFCKDFKLINAVGATNAFLIGSIVTSCYLQGVI